MQNRVFLTWVCILAAAPLWGAGSHSPLLAQPREVRYGPGRLSLRGLTIRFGSDPSPEDRFTAGELSSFLSSAARTPIGLSASPAAGRTITLKRNGPVAALPVPGEHPGPESREAYSIQV